jgi:uncharacterized membrane protein
LITHARHLPALRRALGGALAAALAAGVLVAPATAADAGAPDTSIRKSGGVPQEYLIADQAGDGQTDSIIAIL